MDMYMRKQTNPKYSNRIDTEEVKRLYKQREHYKISLNDQLEHFYNRCKNNRFFKHEVTYFLHAECLHADELQQYQMRFFESLMQRYETDLSRCGVTRLTINEEDQSQISNWQEIHSEILEKNNRSKNSDYRLYGGIRATLVFHPRWDLPSNEELSKLCEEIQPMMYAQLWRKWNPINIPVSTKQVDVIGFAEHTLLDDEDSKGSFTPLSPDASADDTVPVSSVLSTPRINTQNLIQYYSSLNKNLNK